MEKKTMHRSPASEQTSPPPEPLLLQPPCPVWLPDLHNGVKKQVAVTPASSARSDWPSSSGAAPMGARRFLGAARAVLQRAAPVDSVSCREAMLLGRIMEEEGEEEG